MFRFVSWQYFSFIVLLNNKTIKLQYCIPKTEGLERLLLSTNMYCAKYCKILQYIFAFAPFPGIFFLLYYKGFTFCVICLPEILRHNYQIFQNHDINFPRIYKGLIFLSILLEDIKTRNC